MMKSFPELGESPPALAQAVEDCVGQGLGAMEVAVLAASMEKGRVVPGSDVDGVKWATDPRSWDCVRKSTKYDQHTFSKLLEKGL